MRVTRGGIGTEELEVFPVPNTRHEFDAEEIGQAKNRRTLTLRISMDGIGLDVGLILEQSIENVDRLPHPTGNEVTEEGDVGIGDVIVAISAAPNYAKEHIRSVRTLSVSRFHLHIIRRPSL